MTREEKNTAVETVLSRYDSLGSTLVSDDQSLCRLLSTLHMDNAVDRDVGDYLCSFLTA